MRIPLFHVDAFTSKIFRGNPAAVCPLDAWLTTEQMQQIAAENNLSETAFFVENGSSYELRWFTPKIEVDLCGHATLASAHILFTELGYTKKVIHFKTAGGDLKVSRSNELLTLDFPATPPEKFETPLRLVHALGAEPEAVYRSRDIMAVFETQSIVKNIRPDFAYLKDLDCLGVIITAPGTVVDFVSRFFAPAAGVDEDPVTGSAHTTLIPYWADRLKKDKLLAYQISDRGGELLCVNSIGRVYITGRAFTYFKGEINPKGLI
ncbi:MAG: PhzF family phenazine biosynthesis protein [FCB group bacterium]|nr:PhzF family phenazine biosynthesis protein [FCB group bacterium]